LTKKDKVEGEGADLPIENGDGPGSQSLHRMSLPASLCIVGLCVESEFNLTNILNYLSLLDHKLVSKVHRVVGFLRNYLLP